VCPGSAQAIPCILGNGGGLALRLGYRSRGAWYWGGAYEFSRQDSSNLLRLAILQQFRAEARYHLSRITRVSPYLVGGLGGVIYGNEWGLSTWGGGGSVGLGLEAQVTPRLVTELSVCYRAVALRAWQDGTGEERAGGPLGFGVAHLIGIEFGVDIRQPLARW
jgi:opacity protein-like surface antigen